MVVGLLLGVTAWAVYPALLAWMLPALLGMVIAAPMSWVGARLSWGLAARRNGLFIIPEETTPLSLLTDSPEGADIALGSGLERVTRELVVGSLHLALLSQHRPAEPTDAMTLARYRAQTIRHSEELTGRFDRRLQAAALADSLAIHSLRRRIGGYRV